MRASGCLPRRRPWHIMRSRVVQQRPPGSSLRRAPFSLSWFALSDVCTAAVCALWPSGSAGLAWRAREFKSIRLN